jgi:hypothetical protein
MLNRHIVGLKGILLGHSKRRTQCNHHETKLWCTLQLRGQRNSFCFPSPVPSSVIHTLRKKVSSFPVPSRDVTYQTLPGRE